MRSHAVNFVLVGDLHIEAEPHAKDSFFDELWSAIRQAEPRPDFAVFLGDITQRGLPSEYRRAKELLADCPVPWTLVRGNHDKGHYAALLADAGTMVPVTSSPEERLSRIYRWNALYWEEQPGTYTSPARPLRPHYAFYDEAQEPLCAIWDAYRADYSFEVGGIRFVVMDACRWVLDDGQMQFLSDELARGEPTILMMHHHLLPVWYRFDAAQVWNAPEVLGLLRRHPNVLGSFHGHVHFNRQWQYDGRPFVTTGYRNFRFVRASADGAVTVGPSNVAEPTPAQHEHFNLVVSGFSGTLFRMNDPRLWRFAKDATWGGLAWAGKADSDQGIEWSAYVSETDCGRPCRLRLCVIAQGAWRAQLAAGDGRLLARREGRSAGERQEIDLEVTFDAPDDYRLSLTQPDADDNAWVRAADFALLDFGDGRPTPEGWYWGDGAPWPCTP